jgi:hypothetical protein
VALKVQNLKYDARTHKAIRHSWSSLNKKNKKTTSANIVNAIRILAFHCAYKVALKVQNLKYDARTHKAIRHSWSSLNKNKNENSTSANVIDAIRILAFH